MFKSSFFVLLLLFSFTVIAQQDDSPMDPNAALYYNQSVEALKAGSLQEADAYVDSALSISKNDLFIYLKGDINFKMQKWDIAKLQFEEFIKVTKDAQRKTDAQSKLEDITQMKAVALYNEGVELSQNSKYTEALAKFDQSLQVFNDPKVYLSKGVTYSKMEKNAEAIAEVKKAIELKADYDVAYYTLGGLYLGTKDYPNALINYNKALELTQNDNVKNSLKESLKITYFQLGIADYKAKKWDAAIENFNKSVEQAPFDQSYLWMGKAYIEKKKYDLALESLDKALSVKKSVSDGVVAYWKGSAYKQKGDQNKALEFFKAGLSDESVKKACQSEIAFINASKQQKK